MAEFIPEVVTASEYDSKTVEIASIKNDYKNEYIFKISLDDLYDATDDYANWVHFGVGGPA